MRPLLVIALLTLYKLWLCTTFDVTGDEAHYWMWAQNLDASYYSKPPAVAYTIWLGTALFGDTELGMRWPAVLLSAGTAWLLYSFARRLFGPENAWLTLLLACVAPMFALGSVVMTIDPLSVFFWTAAMITFWRAKESDGLAWWCATGLLVGLGALSKYTNLAQLLSFALFLGWQAELRGRRKLWIGLGLTTLVTLACFSPVLWWNASKHWITVTHVAESGNLDSGFRLKPLSVLEWLGGQAGVLSPLVFLGVLWLAFRPPAALRGRAELRYALSLFLPLFLGYTLLSFNRASNANWAALAYPCMLVVLPAAWSLGPGADGNRRRWKTATLWTGGVLTGLFLLAPLWLRLPFVPIHKAPFNRALGFPSFAAKLDALRDENGAPLVIAGDRSVASLLAFYLPDHPRTFIPTHSGIRNQFSLWPGYADGSRGDRALIVTIEGRETLPESLRQEWTELTDLGVFQSQLGDRPVRSYRVHLATGLRKGT